MAPIKSNSPFASYFDFFSRSGTDASNPYVVPTPISGLTATGGFITDYESGGTYYRVHTFTSTGNFDVTNLGDGTYPSTVAILAVGGGGAGGQHNAAGGGAGGLQYSASTSVLVSPYTITVGSGGAGSSPKDPGSAPYLSGGNGTTTTTGGIIAAAQGGGGGAGNAPSPGSGNGGSGGGEADGQGVGLGNREVGTTNPAPSQGNNGGASHPTGAAGGGGHGGAGGAGASNTGGAGGAGSPYDISGTATFYAGGGGGGTRSGGTAGSGGSSIGGAGAVTGSGGNGSSNTGSGGGGGGYQTGPIVSGGGGSGGPGIAIIRYQIKQNQPLAKATGGSISFYGGKTIHAFIGNGTFATTSDWSEATVEYVVIGGGGGGGNDDGGGGGAGAVKIGTTPIGAHPVSTTIQVGAGGAQNTAGTPSYFGTPITAPGGGYGGTEPSPTTGGNGGSGGGGSGGFGAGGAGTGTGDDFPGSSPFVSPSNGWGNDGGAGRANTGPAPYSGGGGGGASEAGAGASQGNYGGRGMQLSPTFRDPARNYGSPGDVGYGAPQPGKYFAAGGGGTRTNTPLSGSGAGVGGIGGGGWGGSNPSKPPGTPTGSGTHADANTGSGGGGGDVNNQAGAIGGTGGSGIVLIAYPT